MTALDYYDDLSYGVADVLDDGYGNLWALCGNNCDMEIVRPGKVQCSGQACADLPGFMPDDERSAYGAFDDGYDY